MPDQYRNPYFDSSVFIAWIKGETRGTRDCRAIAEHNFRLASGGVFKINTSAVTLAEVHKRRGEASPLDPAQDDTILEFFEHEYINIIDVDREIGEQANRFCRSFAPLAPIDSIHLACALRAKCDVLLAWDHHFGHVTHPNIRFENPDMLGQLELPDRNGNA